MSTLRQRLKRPETYLAMLGLALALTVADSYRLPSDQLTARLYVVAVSEYQEMPLHLVTKRWVRCRYEPTCSRYSVQAVQRFGLRKGLALTTARLWRCRGGIPLGTVDPVPDGVH